jgi:predicted alpha/beta hydrolase family esterase
VGALTKHRWRWLFLIVLAIALLSLGHTLIAVRGTFAPSRPESQAGGRAITVRGSGYRLAGRVYCKGRPVPGTLVVVLHGDAPFVKPSYQYVFAESVASAAPGTPVVALLRPGYADPYGGKSDGDRGFAVGENYTYEVVESVAGAIQSLKSQMRATKVVLVGHSGGATIAANVAALNPELIQHAFLVGCPCDVPAFRRHMARLQWSPMWLLPTHSLSPLQTLDRMGDGTIVTAISGANDPIALPQYARSYVAKARERGISADMIVIPNQGHEILNDPLVIQEVAKAVRSSF